MSSEAQLAGPKPDDAHRLSVFGWRYVSRIQTERTIALARIVLAAASLFAVWLDPAEPTRYVQLTYALHSFYLLYAIILALTTRHRQGPSRLPLITHIIDIVAFSVFRADARSVQPFFVYFVFSLFCGAALGWRGTLIRIAVLLVRRDGRYDEHHDGGHRVRAESLHHSRGSSGGRRWLLVYLGQHEARLRALIVSGSRAGPASAMPNPRPSSAAS
jgi:hypothetical protein